MGVRQTIMTFTTSSAKASHDVASSSVSATTPSSGDAGFGFGFGFVRQRQVGAWIVSRLIDSPQ